MTQRFSLDQDTPLTCIWMSGMEYGVDIRDEFVTIESGITYQTTDPHQVGTDGGLQYIRSSSSNEAYSTGFPNAKELVIAAAIDPGTASAGRTGITLRGTATDTFSTIITGLGEAAVIRGALVSTPLAYSSAGAASVGAWNWMVSHVLVDNSGFADCYLQSFNNKVLSYTGDTQSGAPDEMTQIAAAFRSVTNAAFDEIMVFARTIYYTSGAGGGGAPVAGNTLTDGTTGATAVITNVFDDGGGNGVLFIHNLTESGGSGFVATNTINDGSGWTATASNSNANDEASLWVNEAFMELAYPSSDSSVAWSTTGVSNYTEVDDADTTASYVSTGTATTLDVYGLTNVIPVGATPIGIHMSTYARQNGAGSVDAVSLGFSDTVNVGTADSDNITLPTSYNIQSWIWTKNTVTGSDFTEAEINGLEFRLTAKA